MIALCLPAVIPPATQQTTLVYKQYARNPQETEHGKEKQTQHTAAQNYGANNHHKC